MGTKSKAWIAVKKKRGGQPGNRNRYVHGGYSTATRARREKIRAFIRRCHATIAWVESNQVRK